MSSEPTNPASQPLQCAPRPGVTAFGRSTVATWTPTWVRTWTLAFTLALPLAGCALMGAGNTGGVTRYAPDPRVQAQPEWPRVDWSLTIAQPTAARAIDSARIAVRPTPQELQVYKGAQWAKRPSEMLEDAVLRALEDSGRIGVVTRAGAGIATDYRLVLDIRRFESDYASGAPATIIEVSAKLLHGTAPDVVASRTFLQTVPARDAAVPAVVDAFETALAGVARELAGWTLGAGATPGAR